MKTKQLDVCVADLMHQAQSALNKIINPENKVKSIAHYLQALAMLNASITEDTFQYGAYFECIKDKINLNTSEYYSEAVALIEEAKNQIEKPDATKIQEESQEVSEAKKIEKTPTVGTDSLQVVCLDETNHFKVIHEVAVQANVAGLSPQEIETWIAWFEEYCAINDSQSIEDDFKQFCNNVYNHLEEVDQDTLLAYIFSLYAKLYPEEK